MATYISTIKFTQQGVKGIAETTKRAAAMKTVAKKLGIKVINTYWTFGNYDGLLILDAPDDETVTTLLIHLGSKGNIQTSTVRAFGTAEMEKVLEHLPD